jgi:mutator protein MutT
MANTLRQSTLLFLRDKDKILLAMKKRGFGMNRYNGVGGKVNKDENVEQAAMRECQEEILVTPLNLEKVAELNFYFPKAKSDWNQQVSVYVCYEWLGDPLESEEMKPEWFNVKNIPYDKMWSDDKYWLPEVIKGNYLNAVFEFDDDDTVIKSEVQLRKINF